MSSRFRPPLPMGLPLVLLFAIAGLWLTAKIYPSYLLSTTLLAYLAALVWVGALAGSGARLLSLLLGERKADFLFGLAMGCGIAGLILFGLALSETLHPIAIDLLLILLWLLGLPAWKQWLSRPPWPKLGVLHELGIFGWATLGSAIVFGLLMLLYGSLPPVLYDTMVYHMALPEQYLIHQGLVALPNHLMSAYPKLHELLLTVPLLLGGPEAANAFTALLMLAAAGIVGRFGFRLGGPAGALAAFSLTLTLPLVVYLGSDVKNDVTLAFLELAALGVLVLHDELGPRRLLTVGILAGFAACVKYPALAFWPGLVLTWLAVDGRSALKKSSLNSALWGLVLALGVAFPFYLFTTITTGSPIYPSYPELFGTKTNIDYQALNREIQTINSAEDLSSFLYNIFFDPFKIDGDHAVLGTLMLLLLPFLSFLGRSDKRIGKALFIAWFWQLVPLVLISTKLRFFPLFFLLPAAMIGAGAARAALAWNGWRLLAGGIFLFGSLHTLGLQFALGDLFFPGALKLLSGEQPRKEYLESKLPGFLAFEKIQDLTRPNDTVLLDGERRFAYLNRPVIVSSPYQPCYLDMAFNAGMSADDTIQQMRRDKIKVVYFSDFERKRLGERPYPPEWLDALTSQLKLVWMDDQGKIFLVD